MMVASRNTRRKTRTTASRWSKLYANNAGAGAARAARAIFVAMVAALVVGGIYGITHFMSEYLFRNNSRFLLKNLSITTGNTVSAEVVRQVTGLRENINLFSVNPGRIRRDFLRNLPNVRDIRIERRLPDAIKVSVYERIPVARLSRNGRVVTDFDGYLFKMPSAHEALAEMLPVLASEEWASLEPGQRLGARPRMALVVLDTAEAVRLRFRIAEIDTTGSYVLLLQTTDRREIGLPWDSLRDRETLPDREAIREMLQLADATMFSQLASSANRFDVNLEDRKVYARYE